MHSHQQQDSSSGGKQQWWLPTLGPPEQCTACPPHLAVHANNGAHSICMRLEPHKAIRALHMWVWMEVGRASKRC